MTTAHLPVPPTLTFWLTVQPQCELRAWRAWLQPTLAPGRATGGDPLEFGAPIELLRHLVQIGLIATPADAPRDGAATGSTEPNGPTRPTGPTGSTGLK